MRGPILRLFSGPVPQSPTDTAQGQLLMEYELPVGTTATVAADGRLTFVKAPVAADNCALTFTRPKGAQWKRERRGRGGR